VAPQFSQDISPAAILRHSLRNARAFDRANDIRLIAFILQ
jgi:hypothetical protein